MDEEGWQNGDNNEQKGEALNNFLPRSSLASSPSAALEWMSWKMGAGGAKALAL